MINVNFLAESVVRLYLKLVWYSFVFSFAETTLEAGVKTVFFFPITIHAKGLQVANIIRASKSQWNNMIDGKSSLLRSFVTTFATNSITFKNKFLNFWRNKNSWSFSYQRHFLSQNYIFLDCFCG